MNIKQIVSRDWTVAEIVAQYPQTTEVLSEYGLHCFGCHVSAIESIEEGCRGHGFSEEDIDLLIVDINDAIENMPKRPQIITITKEAAIGIKKIAASEHPSRGASSSGGAPSTNTIGLSVQANKDGSFYMEFRDKIEEGEKEFMNEEVPEVKIWASVLTLQRIGGAVITVKEGKFKLEVGEVQCCQGEEHGKCGCT